MPNDKEIDASSDPSNYERQGLSEIQYKLPGIAHFPLLSNASVQHGFSWGSQINMAYKWDVDPESVTERIEIFLATLGMQPNTNALVIEAYADREIFDATPESIPMLENRGTRGTFTAAHAVFTDMAGIPVTVKPGDCLATICYGVNYKGPVVGIIHAGRREINAGLPYDALTHFLERYKVEQDSVLLGITPGLGKINHTLTRDQLSTLDTAFWQRYLDENGDTINVNSLGLLLEQFRKLVKPEAIQAYDVDTYAEALKGKTFSHRYSSITGQQNGRYLAAIQI